MVKDVLIVSIFIFVLCVLFVPPDRGGGWLRVGSEERVKWRGSGEREESQENTFNGEFGVSEISADGDKTIFEGKFT